MKAKWCMTFLLALVTLLSVALLAACGGDKTPKKTYLSMKIDASGVGALTDGDLFNPKTLRVTMTADRGADGILDLANATVTVDGAAYTGSPIEVHEPSCTVKIVYEQGEGKPALTGEVTLDVAKKTDPAPTPKKAKVIIMAGQSNMVGHSMVDSLTPEQLAKYQAGFKNVLIFNSCNPYNPKTDKRNLTTNFIPVKTGMGRIPDDTTNWPNWCFGPELGLAEYLSETYPDETFYIIKDATGGTTLHDKWYSPSSLAYLGKETLAENSLYAHLLTRVDEGMELLGESNIDAEIVALLWMQGENDASQYTADYATLWANFVGDLTADWESKGYVTENGLATIDGGISEYWANYEILNAVKELWAAEHSKGYYVDVIGAGLTRKPSDPAHLDSPSMLRLGRLFGEKLSLAIADLGNAATVTPVTLRGTGTSDDPYLVGSYAEWLRLAHTAFIDADALTGKYIRLTSDIGSADVPVRASLGVTSVRPFSGTIDGDGHTIYVNLRNRQYKTEGRAMGLIGYANGATLENLTVAGDVTLTVGNFYAAGFIGMVQWANGAVTTIRNCVNLATVNVIGASNAGGFVGRMLGNLTIVNSENKGNVTTAGNYAAGIVGYINNSTAAGAGAPSLTVIGTVNSGNIKGQTGVGGIVGLFMTGASGGTHVLTDVSNTGTLTGNTQVGGIIGVVTSQAASGFHITVIYLEAGLKDESGADIVIGADGNKQTTAVTKRLPADDPDGGDFGGFIPFV